MAREVEQLEFLITRYLNELSDITLPHDLIKLIQKFYHSYEHYFYWRLPSKKCNQETTFKIEGIKFKLKNFGLMGIVSLGIAHVNPIDIEHAIVYAEMKCPTARNSSFSGKKRIFVTYNKHKALQSIFFVSYKPDELANLKTIFISCKIVIKHIKYQHNAYYSPTDEIYYKNDYYAPLNQMHRHYEYTWNINGTLLQQCQRNIKHKYSNEIHSDNFDNNHWCLSLLVNKIQTISLERFIVNGIESRICRNVIYRLKPKDHPFGPTCLSSEEEDNTWIDFWKQESVSIVVKLDIIYKRLNKKLNRVFVGPAFIETKSIKQAIKESQEISFEKSEATSIPIQTMDTYSFCDIVGLCINGIMWIILVIWITLAIALFWIIWIYDFRSDLFDCKPKIKSCNI
eukprot:416807_1